MNAADIRLLPLERSGQESAEGVRAKFAVYRVTQAGGELEGVLQLHRDGNWRLFTGPFGARFEQVFGRTLGPSALREALEPDRGTVLGFRHAGPGRKRLAWKGAGKGDEAA